MIDWSGKRRWIAGLLLLAGIGVMLYVPPVIPVIQLPGEVYPEGWKLFGVIAIPNFLSWIGLNDSPMTNTLMGSIAVWIVLMIMMIYISRRIPRQAGETPPGGFYNFFEMMFEGLYNFISGIAGGPYMDVIFKMFMTIFLIVLISNWTEIIPGVDAIGFIEPHIDHETGEPTDGYDVYETFVGGWALNAKCEWVSPEEAELLTEDEVQERIDNGCKSGVGAVAESHGEDAAADELGEEASATSEADSQGDAETATEEESVAEDVHEDEAAAEAEGEHGEVHHTPGDPNYPWVVLPFIRAPSTDLSMTLSIALIAVVMTQYMGFKALGLGYLGKFFNFRTLFNSPLGGIDVAVGILELIGEIARILSFAFRLLGNIFAGSILLFVMSFLLPFLPWPFFILEFFVAIIQALVFGLLTAIFMNLATISHHHEEEHEH